MERVFGALALIALVAIPFLFSRRKKMKRLEDWDNNRENINLNVSEDISTHNSVDGGHH